MREDAVGGTPVSPSMLDAPTGVNLLIEALPPDDRDLLSRHLKHVPLPVGMTIHDADQEISSVHFPLSGIVSMVSRMPEGVVEVGTVGREGMTGVPIVLRASSMPIRAFVQVEGESLCMPADTLRNLMKESESLDRLLHRYALALFDQAAQNAACNRLHTLEARCARWLLMSHDRVGADVLHLKQSFLAEMLGVHRPAVTVAAGALQHAGIIRYSRGRVTVLDREALEQASCGCYEITRRSFEQLRVL